MTNMTGKEALRLLIDTIANNEMALEKGVQS